MPRPRKSSGTGGVKTADYRHTGKKRTNIPTAKMAAEGKIPAAPKAQYHYNPHLPPVLRFDPAGKADKLPDLIAAAGRRALTADEQKLLAEALRNHQPWLEWATKREQHDKGFFEVDPVALHIHERVSAQAIVRAATREDVQRNLFADPEQPYQEAVQFYKHDVDWANRLILGDSLQVMSSLARRENLAGKVQMIYMDPPYGIKFGSNFQAEINRQEMKEKDSDLTRQPEMVKAYRDTWVFGIHSYLSYLRSRLFLCKELLSTSGSIFVQISDVNVHVLRSMLDEVFGFSNFISQISFAKTSGSADKYLATIGDFLLWYAKDKEQLKYRQLHFIKTDKTLAQQYRFRMHSNGSVGRAGDPKTETDEQLLSRFMPDNLTGQGENGNLDDQEVWGKRFRPTTGRHWSTTNEGIRRLFHCERLFLSEERLAWRKYVSDYPVSAYGNFWTDTAQGGRAFDRVYVVQTADKIIERCVLMTTDPGDIILDPTCGSGATAYVAEQWGRRWITIDTSRVALSIARQRLLTAKYEHYKTKDGSGNPATGFNYKTVPHITLKSIAQNTNLDPVFAKHEPVLNATLAACNKALASVSADARRKHSRRNCRKSRPERASGRSPTRTGGGGNCRRRNLSIGRFHSIPIQTGPRHCRRRSPNTARRGGRKWTR